MPDVDLKTQLIIALKALEACNKMNNRRNSYDPRRLRGLTKAGQVSLRPRNSDERERVDDRVNDLRAVEACIAMQQAKIVTEETVDPPNEDACAELPFEGLSYFGGYRLDGVDISTVEDSIIKAVGEIGFEIATQQSWASTSGQTTQRLIGRVATSLKELLHILHKNNELADSDALSNAEKAQLVALLETALTELKGPTVERSRWSTVVAALLKFSGRVAERQLSESVEHGCSEALSQARQLAEHLATQPNWPHFPFL